MPNAASIGRTSVAVSLLSLPSRCALAASLWLVANRHLPYEAVLSENFPVVRTVVQRHGYKIIEAVRARAQAKLSHTRSPHKGTR